MIRKLVTTIIILLCITGILSEKTVANQQPYTLRAGVSMIDNVPKGLFGTWRVQARLVETNSKQTFKATAVDIWNLSREGDVIKLDNPFTGANAIINVSVAQGRYIKFTKKGVYDRQNLSDVVSISINGDKFEGINSLVLETKSAGKVMKTERATYKIIGEKISGSSIKSGAIK